MVVLGDKESLDMIKSTIQSVLSRYGYRLVKGEPTSQERDMSHVLAHASQLGFRPATVIDVGVASGTPALYETFPDAFHLMIEPVDEFADDIRSLLGSYRGKAVFAAAASADGEIEIHVHTEHLEGSSSLQEQMGADFDGAIRRVKAVTLDNVVAEEDLEGPYLVKVDVQGAELDVLDGARRVLADTDLVLLEVAFFEFLRGSPQFFDVVLYMNDRGFVVYDIYGVASRPLDGALGQCDVAFVRDDGMFRTDHRYATADQWAKLTSS
jgi:FkbM family methyltransferase